MTIAETEHRIEPRDHVVQFYECDDELVTTVGQYLVDGVSADETALVVATAAHTIAFETELLRAGVDVAAARANANLVTVDVEQALSSFLVDGRPNAYAFATEVGGLIRQSVDAGRRVRVYGEMVALLWDAGHVAAAIELEALWNELGQHVQFSLFCAYPVQSVTEHGNQDSFQRICHLHSAVVDRAFRAPDSKADLAVATEEVARSFHCGSQMLTTTRHFAAETLTSWGLEKLVDDVSIVVSELATNAVRHTGSDFVVALSWRTNTVRVSVRDAGRVLPILRNPAPTTVSGRGLLLVASIADQWGTELVSDGKVVWAEIRV